VAVDEGEQSREGSGGSSSERLHFDSWCGNFLKNVVNPVEKDRE
jgi:hypothetical protein